MGLMLGEFVDDFTVNVIDVFAMPQSGTVSFLILISSHFDFAFFRVFRLKLLIRYSRPK
jgi:hypothetical protein